MLWRTLVAAVLLALAVLAAVALLDDADRPAPEVPDGAVLLFRHALTDPAQTDVDPTARGDCTQQRNLSADGVVQAQRIGRGLRQLPVTAVYASPFCRTVDTAAAFDVGPVQVTEALLSTTAALDAAGREAIVQAGADLLAQTVGGDGVVVIVTHTQNIEALTGRLVEEGDAVVPVGGEDGAVEVVDVIPAGEW